MRQLTLDIRAHQEPSLETFIPGDNVDAWTRAGALKDPKSFESLYLWGTAGCGRTHLLRATVQAALRHGRSALYLDAGHWPQTLSLANGGLLAVDDVHLLPADAQHQLFTLWNAARFTGLALLIAGSAPPADLPLREDLRTRIAQALVYQLRPLADDDLARAIRAEANRRGMDLTHEMSAYLLRHCRRELPVLMGVLDALDEASLTLRRLPSLSLLREILNPAQSRPGPR
ncbi:MAG: hypothetical protein AMXMBFR6_17030 [Betaproteobacteria bacterium]